MSLTRLETKLAEVLGLATATRAATAIVVELVRDTDEDLADQLARMGETIAETEERCRERGWVDGEGELTDAGRALREGVETTTDALAAAVFEPGEIERAIATLDPLARAVAGSATIRYPNPMGLPQLS